MTVIKSCVHLGDEIESKVDGLPARACRLHGRCVPAGQTRKAASCESCKDRLTMDDPDFASRWIDPLVILNRRREKTDALRDLLCGGSAFLVCGGPSAGPHLEKLNRRGCFSLAVNNAAGHGVRPQAFVCSDPPMKFSHSIWLDPGVMKFVPTPKMNGRRALLRGKTNGVFERMERSVTDCPNVWGFRRESWMEPDDRFFTSEGACWGNQNAGVERTGQPKTVCTMLPGLRLLYHLGARRIFLVGVDFHMRPDHGYSFPQGRTPGASASNTAQFKVVNSWLCQMQENDTFGRFGLELYNTCERSGLRTFPHVPFDRALELAVGTVEENPDLSSWYEKASCPKCDSWHVRCGEGRWECLNCGLEWDPERPPGRGKKGRRGRKV